MAEAGSGKSTEIGEQARLLELAGRQTFVVTVRGAGQCGVVGALGIAGARRWQAWRQTDQPTWLFVDSVDEAKARDIQLTDALRAIADAIDGVEGRVHVILTGRYTDWEYRTDLTQLERWLPMAPADRAPPSIDPDELLIRTIRRDDRDAKPEPVEAPLVVVLSALDRAQVEKFVRGKRADSVDAFIDALDGNDLWPFARRPLDLGWLVDYWRSKGTFGTLAQMLEVCLRERLKEPDPRRARTDPIDDERALVALERVGAALVLQRRTDIVVPDSTFELSGDPQALDLVKVLPDWSGEHRIRFITRPVFDPSQVGFARLHNDNERVVCSYLAARWLKRLIESNCPQGVILDLLFANMYGISLVIPSLRQTAAWLSLWRPEVCREVITRDPRLLMDAGDPASLSLSVREDVLTRVVHLTADDEHLDVLDRDSLKRFARPDMVLRVRELWSTHGHVLAVRRLLLSIISLGPLAACADLAVAAWSEPDSDERTRVYAVRAVAAAGSSSDRQHLARDVVGHARDLPGQAVWQAVDALFPTPICVGDLSQILDADHDTNYGVDFDYLGPKLPQRLNSTRDCEQFIELLLARVLPLDEEKSLSSGDEALLDAIEAGACRLLDLSSAEKTPTAAIDAAMCLCERRDYRRYPHRDADARGVFDLLTMSPARRRTALWAAVVRLSGHPLLKAPAITQLWELDVLGFRHGLTQDDVAWLLEDAQTRPASTERLLAADAAMWVWQRTGQPAPVLTAIRAATDGHPELTSAIERGTRAPTATEQERKMKRAMRQQERRGTVAQAERDESWRTFAESLRRDPDQLRRLKPPSEKGVDGRLYHLWQLLNGIGRNRSRHAIDDLSPLVPMLGAKVVDALRHAFMTFWRQWMPTIRTERSSGAVNTINGLDCIGIVGVTQESLANPDWARALRHDDAVRAAMYATLELNGFPNWLRDLALAHPQAVREVLRRTIAADLARADLSRRADALEDLARSDPSIASVLAPELLEHLRQHATLPASVLNPILRIICAAPGDSAEFIEVFRTGFSAATMPYEAAAYFRWLFKFDLENASAALTAKLDGLTSDDQTRFGQAVLVRLLGDSWGRSGAVLTPVPLPTLERMVLIAYRAVRPEDDKDHSDGEPYSPDERDDAENGRARLLKELFDRPGPASFDAIGRLADRSDFPVPRLHLLRMARNRAEGDAERGPWSAADLIGFEKDNMMRPRHPHDLQRLIMRQLRDMEHDLLNADYAQGATLAAFSLEAEVQNFIADRMRPQGGNSYSLEREPHTVDEKEPDVRFHAKASTAYVPMEIKVAESWSLQDLVDALIVQLVGKYLRDRENRYGILLLVHLVPRDRGWRTAGGEWLDFAGVVAHLRSLARSIATEQSDAPQSEIVVIDVSSKAPAPAPSPAAIEPS